MAFTQFLHKFTLMFVLCKTHHYFSNEEAESRIQFGKVCSASRRRCRRRSRRRSRSRRRRRRKRRRRRCECNSGELERSPASRRGRRLPIGRLKRGWSEPASDWSVEQLATKTRQQPTTPRGNKVWGAAKACIGDTKNSIIIIIIFTIVMSSFNI